MIWLVLIVAIKCIVFHLISKCCFYERFQTVKANWGIPFYLVMLTANQTSIVNLQLRLGQTSKTL